MSQHGMPSARIKQLILVIAERMRLPAYVSESRLCRPPRANKFEPPVEPPDRFLPAKIVVLVVHEILRISGTKNQLSPHLLPVRIGEEQVIVVNQEAYHVRHVNRTSPASLIAIEFGGLKSDVLKIAPTVPGAGSPDATMTLRSYWA